MRKAFPEARITVVIKEPLADLVRNSPDVDDVITYRMRKGIARIADEISIIRRIRKEYFNLAVVLPYSVSSALWMKLAGVPMRLGSAVRCRGIVLTHPISRRNDGEHQLEYFLRIVRRLGTKAIDTPPSVGISDEDARKAARVLAESGVEKGKRLVGIHPGAAYGPAKRWFPQRFAGLAGRLMKNGISVAIFGAGGERHIVDEIVSGTDGRVANLSGEFTLGELAAAFRIVRRRRDQRFRPDASRGASGTKVVAIFGSTSPGATSPSGQCRII